MARHRRHHTQPWVHWLRVGAVAAGVGAALGGGSAIASATPSDTTDAGTHVGGGPGAEAPRSQAAHPAARQRHRDARTALTDMVTRVNDRQARVRRTLDEAAALRPIRFDAGTIARDVVRAKKRADPVNVPVSAASEDPSRSAVAPTRFRRTASPLRPLAPPAPSTADLEPAAPAPRAFDTFAAAPPSARLMPDLPVPQVITRGVISPVWSPLGFAGTGTPRPTAPVSDIVAAIWVAVREAGGQRPGNAGAAQVTAAAPPSGAALSLDDVAGRPGVTAGVGDAGTVRVISGAFTDTKVEDADGAAQVLNSMSGMIGAPAGFADPDNITVQHVNTAGGYSRTIYRAHHSVDGIDVAGSDVVLVTDSDGNVTGLFNYYDARADAMDTTPDRRVDTETEAAATALAAYAGTPNSPLYLLAAAPLVAAGVVQPQLMIDATDDEAGPQLVWKVSIDPPDTDLTGAHTVNPGSTYYISAGGAQAGAVTRATSNAQPLAIGSPTSTTANDVLGNSRDIGITRLSLVIFDLDSLNDVGRDISTYETTYLLLFLGPPQTPGIPVFRGLFGWDASAVSAHANMATVYDYYATQLGVTSFDDDGAPIVVSTDYNPHETLADYTDGYENAFWDSAGQQFAFGDTGDFEAALDVVGHEYTHAVMEHQGGTLDYGESGALNEAYADIMGVLIEGKDREDPGRWLIGEDTSAGAIRSLADPESTPGYRADYDDLYTGEADEGGEHYNSTIFSHAAYRMMTDARTADVTDERWAELYYVSMTVLDDGAKFSDGRDALVATAHDQGFSDDEIAAIEDAFDSVHVDAGGTVVSV